MEISRKLAIVSIIMLLLAAPLVPSLFLDVPSDDRVIQLSLKYDHRVATWTFGSGWAESHEISDLTFSVSVNNLAETLSAQKVNGYKIWVNVSSWYIGSQVNIEEHIINITDETSVQYYDCWQGEEENTSVFYSKDLGLLILSRYEYFDSIGHLEGWGFVEDYVLTSDNLDALDAIHFKPDGLLIAGIMVEVAIVIGIVQIKHKTKE